MSRLQTPSQTVGPFFGVCFHPGGRPQNVLAGDLTEGEQIRLEGTVLDGARQPVGDALVEIWQANAHGRYRHPMDAGPARLDPAFSGFGRCPTDPSGLFYFDTVKPGAIHRADGGLQASHINVAVFARGMLVHAFTRIYFAGDALDTDPVLTSVDRSRRDTLVAGRVDAPDGRIVYRWNIHLQGERETVFFDA
jgi:protocatechuate 3,4-dioxygenase alpha subunit